jgi:hypothetical protein
MALTQGGAPGAEAFLDGVERELRAIMLLTGSRDVAALRRRRGWWWASSIDWIAACRRTERSPRPADGPAPGGRPQRARPDAPSAPGATRPRRNLRRAPWACKRAPKPPPSKPGDSDRFACGPSGTPPASRKTPTRPGTMIPAQPPPTGVSMQPWPIGTPPALRRARAAAVDASPMPAPAGPRRRRDAAHPHAPGAGGARDAAPRPGCKRRPRSCPSRTAPAPMPAPGAGVAMQPIPTPGRPGPGTAPAAPWQGGNTAPAPAAAPSAPMPAPQGAEGAVQTVQGSLAPGGEVDPEGRFLQRHTSGLSPRAARDRCRWRAPRSTPCCA